MINKQNLWFITLFSLVLILGIYYISIDNDITSVLKPDTIPQKEVIDIDESDILVSLEVEKEEDKQALMQEYQNILLKVDSSLEEKNVAYENIQKLNETTAMEEKIKKMIQDKFKLNAFAKIKDNTISIVVTKKDHNKEMANSIIRSVQSFFKDEKYITVKFNN